MSSALDRPAEDTAARAAEFIRAALSARWSEEASRKVTGLVGEVEWPVVVDLAEAERVAPLLWRWAKEQETIPPVVQHRLRELYLETALENALRLREFASLLRAFSAGGVEVVVLKGIALAEGVYVNVALRPMLDMDILVRRADGPAALDIARACGYRPIRTEAAPGLTLAFENETCLRKVATLDWSLEIHWALFDSPFYQLALPEATVWAEVEETRVEGRHSLCLHPEAQFLHLAGHLMLHHRGEGLLWWADLGEVVFRQGGGFDWDRLLSLATKWRMVLPLRDVVPRLVAEWSALVPNGALNQLAQIPVGAEEQHFYATMVGGYRPPLRRLLDDLSAMPGGWDRMAFLLANLFPSAKYMDERYGIRRSYFRPLYYPYRWGRGVTGWMLEVGSGSLRRTIEEDPR